MRVVLIAHHSHFDTLGGADRSLLAMLDAADPGVRYTVVVSRSGCLSREVSRRGVPMLIAKYGNAMHPVQSGFLRNCGRTLMRRLQIQHWASEIVSKLQPGSVDIVHSNSAVVQVGAVVAKMIRRPHVWHLREIFGNGQVGFPIGGRSAFDRRIREAAAVVCVSDAVRRTMVAGSARDKAAVIYNGVIRREEVVGVSRGGSSSDGVATRMAIIGGLSAAKGQHVAIAALQMVHAMGGKAILSVAGDGPSMGELRELVRSLGLEDSVTFLGMIDDVFDLLARTDILLSCSQAEPMGRTMAEAMVAGVPIIATRGGSVEELLGEGRGVVVDRAPASLAAAIMAVMGSLPKARERAQCARAWAAQRFCVEDMAAAVREIYRSCVRSS